MKTQFDVSKLLENGKIENELDFERALIADRKLRVLAKNNTKYKSIRRQIRDLIEEYEDKNWSVTSKISSSKFQESNIAELISEKERQFVHNRKKLIRKKLKTLKLTQQDFGMILGHKSKSHMSELMNGLSPFTLKDLIIIHRLLKIELPDLIPTFLGQSEQMKIKTSIESLDNPHIKLSKDDFALT